MKIFSYLCTSLIVAILLPHRLCAQMDDDPFVRKNILKTDIAAPLFGHFQMLWEHSIKEKQSFEIGVGVSGFPNSSKSFMDTLNNMHRPIGLSFRAGYKFFFTSKNCSGELPLYDHILAGHYLKPEVVYSFYNYTDKTTFVKTPITATAILLNLGTQGVVQNRIAVDISMGIGYSFLSTNIDGGSGNEFSFSAGNESAPWAFSLCLKVGYVFR